MTHVVNGNNKRKSSLDILGNPIYNTVQQSTTMPTQSQYTQHISLSTDTRIPSAPATKPKHTLIEPDPILLPPSPTTSTRSLQSRRKHKPRVNTMTQSPAVENDIVVSSGLESSSDDIQSDDEMTNHTQQPPKRHMSISSNTNSASTHANTHKNDMDADIDLLSRSPTVFSLLNNVHVPATSHNTAQSNRPATERLQSRRISNISPTPHSNDPRHRSIPVHSMSVDATPSIQTQTQSEIDELQFQFDDLKSDAGSSTSSPNPTKYTPSSRATHSNALL